MTEEEFVQLSAGAALGALGTDDLRAYHRALAEHPEWAAQADADAEAVTGLAEFGDEVAPPPALRESILARIDQTPQHSVAEGRPHAARASRRTHRSGRRGWGRRRWFALAASLVLLAGIGTGTVIAVQQANQPVAVVALNRIEAAPDAQQATAQVDGGGSATLHWSASAGQAVLVTGELPLLTDTETFELWYIRGKTPIAAGTFDATGTSTSALLDKGIQPGDVIAITVEHAGGSPTGQPTTQPILTIPTA
ncbi:hypothetical protein GCM10022240_26020 [Microbacterium kribbense]|uniref:Regulator of SigK n=1 Tax=Microbacterium kribbense TaxID=433645 RepID=A0ABP7GT76_9MICO